MRALPCGCPWVHPDRADSLRIWEQKTCCVTRAQLPEAGQRSKAPESMLASGAPCAGSGLAGYRFRPPLLADDFPLALVSGLFFLPFRSREDPRASAAPTMTSTMPTSSRKPSMMIVARRRVPPTTNTVTPSMIIQTTVPAAKHRFPCSRTNLRRSSTHPPHSRLIVGVRRSACIKALFGHCPSQDQEVQASDDTG